MMSPSTNEAKCARFLTAFALVLLLAGPAMLLWASRVELLSGDGFEATLLELEAHQARQIAGLSLPKGHGRMAGLSPFGSQPLTPRLRSDGARGLLLTNLGHLDPGQPEALLGLLPPGLRLRAEEVSRSDRGTLQPGFNYVRISPAAIDARRGAAVNEALQSTPGILVEGYLDEGWRLVYVEPRGLGALKQMGDVDRFVAMEPGLKIDTTLGFRPLINRARAQGSDLHLEVYLTRAADRGAVARDLRGISGVSGVAEHGLNGLMVIADAKTVPGLARKREVLGVREALEFMTLNAKNAPTLQVGSYEAGLGIRAYDEAGVDGGGIDTNGDGRRINNGSDTVPPQIVAVTDNGISYDAPSFSQTATQPFIPITAPIGPLHRKVHGIIAVNDSGNGCDQVLSGSGTHGNVVASVIAAYPTQLGFFANRTSNGLGDTSVPRNSNLDGVARGARIIMQDVADSGRCTINSLLEKGGDVDPGSLAIRMGEILTSGGSQVHLAVLPFGAPDNFSTTQFQLSDGTYPQEAVDLDTFLYNNRDFMIFSPVGNSGAQLNQSRVALWDSILPDLFNGTVADDNPDLPRPVQIPPPATAKNIVAVGASVADCVTHFGASDCEIATALYSSHGPATPQSRRMAPILTAPSTDIIETAETVSIAVFRSNDNDNLAPITAAIDEANFGTSFSAAGVTGAAALVRDYFAQGFYPLGTRVDANRVPNVSGALVKAALIAGAKFNAGVSTRGQTTATQNIRRTRAMNMGTISGELVGVLGNSEQGYGRVLLTGVLPLSSWSKSFAANPGTVPEYPAAGLLVWDDIATGEPALDNTTTSRSHVFRVDSVNRVESRIGVPVGVTGGQAVKRGELRIALAW
ncbi:MAG: S8 family serine peptidase, partial [Candidatus Polarisedimenticolia bacterium]